MRDRDDEQYTVSTSHVGLRVIGLIMAAAVAIGAFSFGFTRMGYKKPGFYEIKADASEEAPLFQNGFTFIYYFDGSSNEIKVKMNQLKEVYGAAMLHSYKLLDSENTYEGFVNMASLNDHLGEEVQVGEEMLEVLRDLWEKTQERRGINLFSGSLLQEWDSILSLYDISEFNPDLNEDVARRMKALARETSRLENFSLDALEDAGKIRLTVSEQYLNFLEENEYSKRVLTAGRLTDAYRLHFVKNTLESQGYTNGYLCTESGLTVTLSDYTDGHFVLYGYDDGQVVKCKEITAGADSACSFLRAFPMTDHELMYHTAEIQQEKRFYHPYFVQESGGFANLIASSCAVRRDGDIIAACYENIALYNLSYRQQIEDIPSDRIILYCTFMGEQGTEVYSNIK